MNDEKSNRNGMGFSLTKEIYTYLTKETKLTGALSGISIRSADTGAIIYEKMGSTRFHPASNMKLLTGAAALSVLGEGYRFSTVLSFDGEIRGDTLYGNIYLQGKGDPTLLPDDFTLFALKLVEQGIHKIEGDIIGDDSWFDSIRLSPDLIWSDEHFYYGSQISALTVSPDRDYDAGTVIVKVQPGKKCGEDTIVLLEPNVDMIEIVNHSITTSASDDGEIVIEREHGSNRIIIKGMIPIDHEPVQEWVAVWEPTYYALHVFKNALDAQNISFTGTLRSDITPSYVITVYTKWSMPLRELFIPFMKLSNNNHAEIFVKEMGKLVLGVGNWEYGLAVLRSEMEALGLSISSCLLRDGSGISNATMIPPNEISYLLYQVQNQAWYPVFLQSLPIAGEIDRMVGGTLRDRMEGLEMVKAKTGTIQGVSTLSGYMWTKEGEELIFSIMLNNLLDEEEGPAIIDQLVTIIEANTVLTSKE
ncbi:MULTISPECIES: D-alanyl-D-alanine carboxypeptidase/D-alanyl-D-alanine-endopeptidase [unclassified Virgibacillus]|uniref:D-alanyl-D-alanine carboxypeptidase/D-alanyl-D-alanine endopeptidase n=1 Tax=unclassified Virgibacillus TaxID=2620237 RepID=UPI0024DE4B9E|nr:D-alanyl-D-alanine carboxypeptidase/D-alanyl-D-alanine-endopeptidase [Virgibacillus sp. LDC-1]